MCDYCENEKSLIKDKIEGNLMEVVIDRHFGKSEIRLETDLKEGSYRSAGLVVNYCPMCGEKI